jgi:hypothetical protein
MSALTPLFEGERTKLGHRGIGENDPPRTLGLIKFEAGFGPFLSRAARSPGAEHVCSARPWHSFAKSFRLTMAFPKPVQT